MELLQKEKELVGMFLSSHPLDKYSFELETFTSFPISRLSEKVAECEAKGTPMKKVAVAGFITSVKQMLTKAGKPWSRTVIEDFDGSYELTLFSKEHEQFMSYLQLHSAI